MPDISLCQNQRCELKDICYRYKAKPNGEYQTYGSFYPTINTRTREMECEYFMKIYKGK